MAFKYQRQRQSISEAAQAARKLTGQRLQSVRQRVAKAIGKVQAPTGNTSDLRENLQQYARGGGIASSILAKFGKLGKAIEYVIGGIRQRGVTDEAVLDAIDLLRKVSPDSLAPEFRGVNTRGPLRPIPIPPKTPAGSAPTPAQPKQIKPPPPPKEAKPKPEEPKVDQATGLPEPPEWQGPLPGQKSGRFVRDLPINMTLVSGSSNVYAYGYDPATHTLRVQFLAAAVHGGSVRKTRAGFRGTLGSTVSQVRGGPGPTYDYFNVPPSVFGRMLTAASKGKAVWDLLRIRGTIAGHQYRYTLSAASQSNILNPEGNGGQLTYVPRKAIPGGGFQARRTSYGVKSILPSQSPRSFGPRSFGPAPSGRP